MRNLKKVLALIVVFAMTMTYAITASAAAVFPDVDSGDDYASAISLLKNLDVVAGDDKGNFNPTGKVTRAEFSKMLFVIMTGESDASLYTGPSAFTDVAQDAWYNGYVNWASNLGIVNGKGDNKFAPNDSVTTQEATKMIIVALTGKSTLAWPYGFVSEANKTNIKLFADATIGDAAAPALRNLIAQLFKNAVFATDVASFYVYNGDGSIASRPSVATAVFDMASLDASVLETSNENYQIAGTTSSGINAVDLMTVSYMEAKSTTDATLTAKTLKVKYPSDAIGEYAGYAGKLYYLDNQKEGTKGLLDTKDTIANFVTNNCTSATVKPLNIVRVSSTYQLGGVNIATTDDSEINTATGKLVVMSKNGTVTAYALNLAALKPYFGATTTSSTAGYGPAEDFDVKVVYDNDNAKLNMVYVTYTNPFVKLTTYSEDASVIAVNDATAFLMTNPNSTSTTLATPTLALGLEVGTAPNKTTVNVDDGVKVGDYVTIKPARNYNGVIYTVSPLLSNKNVTFSGISSDGSAQFGDVTYTKNATVTAANTPGEEVMLAANLGKKMNVYLDSTGKNYIYAELADDVTTNNYVFVKDFTSSSNMNTKNYSVTVTDSKNTTTTYKLADDYTSAYLAPNTTTVGAADTLTSYFYGYVYDPAVDKSVAGNQKKENAAIYHKVVSLTLNSDNEVTKIDPLMPIGTAVQSPLKYDASFKAFYKSGAIEASVVDSTVVYFYDTVASSLTIYNGTDLPGFDTATGFYAKDGTTLKALQLINAGSALTSNVKYGSVKDYTTVAGSTTGKVKYNVTAVVDGQLTAALTTSEESAGGAMSTLLANAKKNGEFVGFTFSADGDTVVNMTKMVVNANSGILDGTDLAKLTANAQLQVGVVTLGANGVFAIAPVSFPNTGVVDVNKNAAKTFSVDADSNFYLIPNTSVDFKGFATNMTTSLKASTTRTLSLGVSSNLVPASNEVRYVVVFSANDKNVIGDAFIYLASQAQAVMTVSGLTAAVTDTTAKLTWTADGNADTYLVEYKADTADTWTALASQTTATATVTGLTVNTLYNFRVSATNSEYTSGYTTVSAKTAAPATNFAAGTPTATTVPLTWTASTGGATGYTVAYKKTADTTWTEVKVTGAATATYTVTGLTAATSYDFKIKATNETSSTEYSAVVAATTAAAA